LDQNYYLDLCHRLRHAGFKLKINTVVTAENWIEDLRNFIIAASPNRWKIFQVLPVRGQNLGHVEPLLVTEEQFTAFVDRHREVEHRGIAVIPETNEAMTGSYAMIDPAGRFYDAVGGGYTYSDPVLDVGVAAALSQVRVSREKFIARGGLYVGLARLSLESSLAGRLANVAAKSFERRS
jgi:radical S-adenosyl methionine domain-containing protein 2